MEFTAKVAGNVATVAAPYVANLSAAKRFHAMKAITKALEASEWLKTHWPDLDEDLSVEGLLAGRRSGEGPRSFAEWLAARQQSR